MPVQFDTLTQEAINEAKESLTEERLDIQILFAALLGLAPYQERFPRLAKIHHVVWAQ